MPWVRAFAALWVAQVVSELAFAFALPFLPLYVLELGVPDAVQAGIWAGVMAGCFALVQAAMGPVWGVLADRYGRKMMIQRGLFGGCVVVGLMSLVHSPEQLLALRVLQGGLTGVVAAAATVATLIVPRRHLASALGAMQAAMLIGQSVGPVVGGAFADQFGLRSAFVATSVIFLATGALVTLCVPEPAREAAGGGSLEAPGLGVSRRELLLIAGTMTAIRFGSYAPQPVLPLVVQQLGDGTEGVATMVGLVLGAAGVASALGALAVGRVARRLGWERTLIASLAAAALLSPLHALVATVGQLVVLRAAIGLALGAMGPAVQTLLTDRTPAHRRGAAFGILSTAQSLGNGGGPVAGSLIAAELGVPAVFVAAGPVFLAGTGL